MKFSQRHGFQPVRSSIQLDELDQGTPNRLITNIIRFYLPADPPRFLTDVGTLNFSLMISDFFKEPKTHETNFANRASAKLIEWSNKCEWFSIIDLVEHCTKHLSIPGQGYKLFHDRCNYILEEEKVGYRLVDGIFTKITSEQEVESIEEAVSHSNKYEAVSTHLKRALELYSDRKEPDYRNSIKESISAVEAFARIAAGGKKVALKEAIRLLEIETGQKFHAALKESVLKLYGYASDEQGVRHSLIDGDSVGHAEAKYLLVGCSSICNFLIEKITDRQTPDNIRR